jgi:hypothetical protein
MRHIASATVSPVGNFFGSDASTSSTFAPLLSDAHSSASRSSASSE